MVQQMIDLFKKWEDNHVGYQRMTSVIQPSGSSKDRIPPHEDADYSADECESYHGDSEQKNIKERHIFTDEEKAAFEAAYLEMANSLVEFYSGLSLIKARTIVQVYCHCRKLPTGVRPAVSSLRLAFDTLDVKE